MAEVWRGVHEGQQVPMAVKVLTGPRAQDPAFVGALKNEIHAVARLNHPGIIQLYDRGVVDAAAAAASAGRLVAGSPWFAMEMCSHGALSPRGFPLPWATTRILLLSLLDALAHAHARGVIHRDLKPGNVLLCAPDDPRPGLKLSDFGIAHPLGLLGADAAQNAHSGTPRSMAPEQFTGAARELGPWTDLYAVGCLAFQLANGSAPFNGDPKRLSVAHCHDPVPVVDARGTYPPAYEAWVLRLLEKRPRDRFHQAADAAWGLLQLTPDDDHTVPSDWAGALRSLRPRPMHQDMELAERTLRPTGAPIASRTFDIGHPGLDGEAVVGIEDTADQTIGPRLASKVGRDGPRSSSLDRSPLVHGNESTGAPRSAIRIGRLRGDVTGVDATSEPTAIARRPVALRESLPPGFVFQTPATTVPPPAPVDSVNETPFATVLHADPAAAAASSSSNNWAPRAPWGELLEMKQARDAQHQAGLDPIDRDHPTAGAPRSATPPTRSGLRMSLSHQDRRPRAPAVPPPSVPSWRRPDDTHLSGPLQPAQRLLGAGLGLFGLRQVPFVGRFAERDRLWSTLGPARAGKDAVVVVRGAAGVGRTRLLEWFGERAAEVGAATTMWASHAPEQGPHDGLVGGMARALRLGLDPDEDVGRILREAMPGLDDDDVALLARTWSGAAAPAPSTVPREQAERHTATRRALRRLASRRPVVVILDDAQWGDDALAFVLRTAEGSLQVERHQGHGLVIVVGIADEAVAERPLTSTLVQRICAIDGVTTQSLLPLPPREHRRCVETLLGLEGPLVDAVAQRSAGNPRFAVELVGDFVERGALELMPAGFALRRGESLALPDTLHAVWAARLERLLSTVPPSARICLELGAVLGEDGDTSEWIGVCKRAGIGDLDEVKGVVTMLIDALERARFVVVDHSQGGALRFAHAMLREAMTRLAHEGGRLIDHHRVVARHLRDRAGPGDDERRARHLLAAGDLDEAMPVLFRAVHITIACEGSARATTLVEQAFAALDHAGAVEDHPHRQRAMALRARVLADAGRYAESTMWAQLVQDTAPREARLDAVRAQALVCARRGELDASAERFQALLRLADHHQEASVGGDDRTDHSHDAVFGNGIIREDFVREDSDAVDDALVGLADVLYYQGRLAASAATFNRALARMQHSGDDVAMATCLWRMAYVALWGGDPAAARGLVLRSQKLARAHRLPTLVGLTRNALGDVERIAGLPDEARHHYQEARTILQRAGSGKVRTVEVNMALCSLAVGDVSVAVAAAAGIVAPASDAGEQLLSSLCHGVLAIGAARAAEWSAADAHLAAFLEPQQRGLVDGEHAQLAEGFAREARHHGEVWRADVAARAAREIWLGLGRVDRLDDGGPSAAAVPAPGGQGSKA